MTDLPICDFPDRDADRVIEIRTPKPEDIREDGSYSPSDARPDCDLVTEVVETAMENDLVIDFVGRHGARPYYRYTPYWNHRGALNPMWSCISYTYKPLPGRSILAWPNIIDPDRSASNEWGTYTPRYASTEFIWAEVRKAHAVYLRTLDASPFPGSMFKWSPDPRSAEARR